MRRRLILLCLLAAAVAGCLDPTPEHREYDELWNVSDDVTYHLEGDSYTAVISLDEGEDNRSLRLWQRDPLGGDAPVTASAVQVNRGGDIENASVERRSDYTKIDVGGEAAAVAYTGVKQAGEFRRLMPVNGSVVVRLQEGQDARNFFLGRITPGGYDVVSERPLTVRWEELDRGTHVSVDYYSRGHPWLLFAAVVFLALVAAAVVYYYRNLIRELRERRKAKERDDFDRR